MINTIKIWLRTLACIPVAVVCCIIFVACCIAENIYMMFTDTRLHWPARVRWYMFSIPPKTCQDCGGPLTESGYAPRYVCRRCDKEWAGVCKW